MSAKRPQLRGQPNFDRIAHPYRWLECLTFGGSLERCRQHFLPCLSDRSHALVLGDGDGRFLARLLAANPRLTADAVDTSALMLELLRDRCHRHAANAGNRLQTHHSDALAFTQNLPHDKKYDLIVTHFFLDCLSQAEVDALVEAMTPHLAPNALWLLSDFRIPPGPMRLPAVFLVRSLYLAFHLLTGLRQTHLPDHTAALTATGWIQTACHDSLGGLLFTERWRFSQPNAPSIRIKA